MEGETPNESSPENELPENALRDETDLPEPPPEDIRTENPAENPVADAPVNQPEASAQEQQNASTENIGLEDVNVRVNFRIGEISMPVNELAALTPGFTLTDLPGLIFPRAQAMASGRVFAEGELVDIDGKIGFRITKLLP